MSRHDVTATKERLLAARAAREHRDRTLELIAHMDAAYEALSAHVSTREVLPAGMAEALSALVEHIEAAKVAAEMDRE